MRVIFNRLSTLKTLTGVGAYAAHLLDELRRQAGPGESVRAFPEGLTGRLARLAYRVPVAGTAAVARPGVPLSAASALASAARGLLRRAGHAAFEAAFRLAAGRGRFDVFHEPNFIAWPVDLPTVLTVHDLSVLRHPEWHPADRVRHHERHFLPAVRRAARVIAVSEFTRRELIELAGVSPEKVVAVPNGVRPGLSPLPRPAVEPALRRLGLPPEYLLFVSTLEPRKNVLTLLRAYCDLPAAVRERCPLVLVGGWGWHTGPLRDYFDTTARHKNVVKLGYCNDADLPALYNGARALVYPSHYEGFGLPPVEMMACGGAVVASTAGAVREVCGERACLVPAGDVGGWRDALCRVMLDDDFRDSLRVGVEGHAARYTWADAARRTLGVYRQAGR